ncbi:hypothetical protein BDV25DRAFT_162265 [Aspergillus avenaceus]|uniref:Secreted protein n=1 Tax=Aspergillus avenaceus TaxID=36643 RepID=A0A5N6TKC2_ASPAV|nr:hypothetical protein BDV25DRAFT_162265 [Aspergillus avenaceus]
MRMRRRWTTRHLNFLLVWFMVSPTNSYRQLETGKANVADRAANQISTWLSVDVLEAGEINLGYWSTSLASLYFPHFHFISYALFF